MPDTGLVRYILAHIGSVLTTTGSASLAGTGRARTAGASTTITGTATVTGIFGNVTTAGTTTTETTTVTSGQLVCAEVCVVYTTHLDHWVGPGVSC